MSLEPLSVTRFSVRDIPSQRGRTVLVTGANNGLGLRSATALAGAGARVLLACRNQQTGESALRAVREAGPNADHALIPLDLADLESVRAAAATARELAPALDVLVNNAGLMAIPFALTADGFEMQFGTNHLGHFALTDELMPSLLAAHQPRVVTLASIAHRRGVIDLDDLNFERRPYDRMIAYTQSKLANLLFGAELARRSVDVGGPLLSVIAHPGVAATNLFDSMVPPVPGAKQFTRFFLRTVGQNESDGALSTLYAATMPDVRNDDYLGPNRLRGMRGPVERSPRTRAAQNEELAKALWDKSVELTGARYSALNP